MIVAMVMAIHKSIGNLRSVRFPFIPDKYRHHRNRERQREREGEVGRREGGREGRRAILRVAWIIPKHKI